MRSSVIALLVLACTSKPVADAGLEAVTVTDAAVLFDAGAQPAPAIASFEATKFPPPPVAPKKPTSYDFHGQRITDDYGWMKEGGKEFDAWVAAENSWAAAVLAPTAWLVATLDDEFRGRTPAEEHTVPWKERGYTYVERTAAGRQHPAIYRTRRGTTHEELLLDLNDAGPFASLGVFTLSDDSTRLAWSLDTTGARHFTLFVKDLALGKQGPEHIEHVTSAAWAATKDTLFYTTEDATSRSSKLFRHVLGTPTSKDTLVHEERDAHFEVSIDRTRSLDFLVLTLASLTTTEVRVLEANRPTQSFRVVLPRQSGVQYDLEHHGPSFFLRINDTGPNFRLVEVPADAPANHSRWKELVPQRAEVPLTDVEVFRDFYVVAERMNGLPKLRTIEFASGREAWLDVVEADIELGAFHNPDYDTTTYRFTVSSSVTPMTVFERDVTTGQTGLVEVTPVPRYDATKYETLRVIVPIEGVGVPVSLAFKKGVRRDGQNPVVLRAYGAYGDASDPGFSSTDISLLDRGVVVALAHVRGGGEFGRAWHDGGRLTHKQTTFSDFIAVAEFLVAQRWAARDRIAIEGASAGGLLIGAVVNQRPELFRVAVADAPFVDVINTMRDESMPLTVAELEEWGDPKEAAAGKDMLAWSPYDNVAAKAMPALLVRSSMNDRQVLVHEPAKWVAKLRATKTDVRPLVFKVAVDSAGHSGHSGRFDALHDEAEAMAFVLWQLGITR